LQDDTDTEEDLGESKTHDHKGIPGWDRVDALAEALVNLAGLAITDRQTQQIKTLYHQLHEYDKRPIVYKPRVRRPPRGRFGRSKGYRSGYVSADAVKRLVSHCDFVGPYL
jgi:hypothetical protein